MIKLIAIDLDGTLLNSQKKMLKENNQAIQKAVQSGIRVVLCTGRPKSGTKPYFEALGLTETEFLILNNGCSTYRSPDWQLLHSKQLTISEIETLYQLTNTIDGLYLTLTGEKDYLVLNQEVPALVQADGDLVFTKVKAFDLSTLKADNQLIFQAMYMGEKAVLDAFEASAKEMLARDFSVVRSQETILEIMPKHVTKASALKELVTDLQLSADQVMAIGDAPNDLEMLAYAGIGVAMRNAHDSIKEIADRVSLSNDAAGVAYAINQFALSCLD